MLGPESPVGEPTCIPRAPGPDSAWLSPPNFDGEAVGSNKSTPFRGLLKVSVVMSGQRLRRTLASVEDLDDSHKKVVASQFGALAAAVLATVLGVLMTLAFIVDSERSLRLLLVMATSGAWLVFGAAKGRR